MFFTNLKAEHLEGKWWKITHPLAYYSKKFNFTRVVPPNFVTDFSSVPRLPVSYLIAGNTQHWEAAGHDLDYRWAKIPRLQADLVFHESAVLRSSLRENQSVFHRVGRWFRRNVMTFFVVTAGWTVYDPVPGCLDYRIKDKCARQCKNCANYYPDWKNCYKEGYWPELYKNHV